LKTFLKQLEGVDSHLLAAPVLPLGFARAGIAVMVLHHHQILGNPDGGGLLSIDLLDRVCRLW